MKTSDLAKECDVTIGPMADEGNVVDFFGDKMGFKLINMYQAFLKHYGGTASDDDYEYLQGQGIYCTSHYIYTKIQAKFLSNQDERAPLVASEAIRVPLGHFASY